MSRRSRAVVSTVGVLVASAAAAAVVRRVAFERRMHAETDALLADARPAPARPVTEADLEPLPEPVRRWLRFSGVVGTQRPTTVRLRQEGEFRMDGKGWLPYRAEQHFTTDPPGFLWRVSVRMAPLVSVLGRDRYRNGEGSLQMRVLGLVPVADETGGGLDQGDLLRYLGEVQWFPAAALVEYIAWESLEADSSKATMTYGGVTASMTFLFGPEGRFLEARADRYNDARRRNEAWVNRNDADREFCGIRVPAVGEARWEYDSGSHPYIRWRITEVQQDPPSDRGRAAGRGSTGTRSQEDS